MKQDLRTILGGWEYEPGKISVRKIIGRDGREKIQTRVDMGLLQLAPTGRPDGARPRGFDTLLEYHESRLEAYVAENEDEEGFVLGSDDCRDLRHESYLFYQRYLSYFVLEEWSAVERDTAFSLRLLDFCRDYAGAAADRNALASQRAYVLMMNTRARAYGSAAEHEYEDALRAIDVGVASIREVTALVESTALEPGGVTELGVLAELRRELIEKMPDDEPIRMEWELRSAVANEQFERAAELRDRIAARRTVRPGA